jgi:hypothetical protein
MRTWYALLVAPMLVLLDQGIAYATAGWACANQSVAAMQIVHALFFTAVIAGVVLAAGQWRAARGAATADDALAAHRFLAGLALASAAFSSIVILALWIPTWILAACLS